MTWSRVRQRLVFVLMVWLATGGSSILVLAETKGQIVTITAEVIGLTCYLKDGERALGEQHKGCATTCFQNGMPVALLDKNTRTVYLPIQPREQEKADGMVCSLIEHRPAAQALHQYVARTVTVSGRVFEGENGVKLIEVTEIKPL